MIATAGQKVVHTAEIDGDKFEIVRVASWGFSSNTLHISWTILKNGKHHWTLGRKRDAVASLRVLEDAAAMNRSAKLTPTTTEDAARLTASVS